MVYIVHLQKCLIVIIVKHWLGLRYIQNVIQQTGQSLTFIDKVLGQHLLPYIGLSVHTGVCDTK